MCPAVRVAVPAVPAVAVAPTWMVAAPAEGTAPVVLSVAAREPLGLAGVRAAALEEERAVLSVFLHEAAVLEARYHGRLALDARVRDGAHLLGVEVVPAPPVVLAEERHHRPAVDEVDERIPHVALVLEVDGQVKKVVGAHKMLVHLLQHGRLKVRFMEIISQIGRLGRPSSLACSLTHTHTHSLTLTRSITKKHVTNLRVLVGNVSNHERGSAVQPLHHAVDV